MSDKNRLRILSALMSNEELCPCQITELLQVAGATASRHLSLMVNSGILKNRKNGRWVYFRINKEDISLDPVFKWVKHKLKDSNQVTKDQEALKKILVASCEDLCSKQRGKTTCSI